MATTAPEIDSKDEDKQNKNTPQYVLDTNIRFLLLMSYYVSLRSEFRVVMSATISALILSSVRLYPQLFVG
jgi:hypothetical protein